MKSIDKIPNDMDINNTYLMQLNYVGNKMYVNVLNGKIYVFDDFGRKVNVSIEAKFNKSDNFLIECIRLTKGVLYTSGYAEGKFVCLVTDVLLWYNNYLQTSFKIRSKIIPFFVKTINQKSFLSAATYLPSDFKEIEKLFFDELSINKLNNMHFNGIVYKNITNNEQLKFKFASSKYTLLENNNCTYKFGRDYCDDDSARVVSRIDGIVIPDTETNFTAYFLVDNIIENHKAINVYIYNKHKFELYIKIKTNLDIKFHHTYKIKVKKNKFKRFAIVKIGFNAFIGDKISDIKFVKCTPTKHIFNVVTYDQLIGFFKEKEKKTIK